MATNPNYSKLLAWKKKNNMTDAELGERLGCCKAYARLLCCQNRIPTKWHERLVDLGFPAELLPRAEDMPIGRPRAYHCTETERAFPRIGGAAQQAQAQ